MHDTVLPSRKSAGAATLFVALAWHAMLPPCQSQTNPGWPFAGADIANTRNGAAETTVGRSNAAQLTNRWVYPAADDVSATPSVDSLAGAVYFPDWSGNILKLDAQTGALIWSHNMAEYGRPAGVISRTTPTLAAGLVLVGSSGTLGPPVNQYAYLLALDQVTGDLVWEQQLDPSQYAVVTSSPIVNTATNTVYVGISSSEEKLTTPTFRGSIVALSLTNGALLWRTYTVPTGYSGGPIWSSTPAIDVARNALYVTTGNNYTVPASVQTCEQHATTPAQISACQAKGNNFDSVIALDLTTGVIKWAHRGLPDDAYILSCLHPQGPCPDPQGMDWDFGAGVNLFTAKIRNVSTDLVGAGQKSGVYWALNRDTGQVVWKTQVGPGGALGGVEWGTATDGVGIYVAISNSAQTPYTVSGMTWNGASWAALNPQNGAIRWQIIDNTMDPVHPSEPAMALGAVTVANGVLYCASMSGAMHAIDTSSGQILWTFTAPGSVNAGPAVVNGLIYWGSGYHHFPGVNPIGTASNQFYAFGLPQ